MVIRPQFLRVACQSEAKGTDAYTQRGTLAGWQQGIAAPAAGGPLLVCPCLAEELATAYGIAG